LAFICNRFQAVSAKLPDLAVK